MNPEQKIRLGLKRLHVGGFSWREIGKIIGRTGGSAWFIARGGIRLKEEDAKRVLEILPPHLFWEGSEGLDAWVLDFLETGIRVTGRELAKLLGTTDRTVRKSIKRLREAGHHIDASMKPRRGYQLRDD